MHRPFHDHLLQQDLFGNLPYETIYYIAKDIHKARVQEEDLTKQIRDIEHCTII
jgi:hypothetical protein